MASKRQEQFYKEQEEQAKQNALELTQFVQQKFAQSSEDTSGTFMIKRGKVSIQEAKRLSKFPIHECMPPEGSNATYIWIYFKRNETAPDKPWSEVYRHSLEWPIR